MSFYPVVPPDATLGCAEDALGLPGQAGVVAVRAADLASPCRRGLGGDGRTALTAAGAGRIRSGDVVVWLKPVAVVDIGVVALGFVVRAVAGGLATGVSASQWFLILTSFLSLFVVAGKRYADLSLDEPAVATRSASGKVINAVAPHLPNLIGGSADLAPSNNTLIKDVADVQAATPAGRNFHFGVRELAMAAIGNGLAAHGGTRPYVATFFVFVDYMRPAMRLSALMGLPVTYVLTHDSVGVGEDGPTHQPVEHLAMLRATPNFIDLRPADANETVEAWKIALQTGDAPVGLMLTRQNLPTIDRAVYGPASGVARGAYVLADAAGGEAPELVLLASGSEVQHVLAAHERLVAEGVRSRVVNMASFRLFERQDAAYRESVLPAACRCRLAVEAAASFGWDRWVGPEGEILAIDRFGTSAPAGTIFERFGFTADNVYDRAKALIAAAAAPVA